MSNQPRTLKVLVSLMVSMSAAAAVLMTLDRQSISAGAFSLASYCSLGSVEDMLASKQQSGKGRWDKIEIFYSNTKGGNLEQTASLSGLSSTDDLNFHFLICNNLGAADGQIQPTGRWLNQWSALQGGSWYGTSGTIRICIIGENGNSVTDCQITRTGELVEALCRKCGIDQEKTIYPKDWRL